MNCNFYVLDYARLVPNMVDMEFLQVGDAHRVRVVTRSYD